MSKSVSIKKISLGILILSTLNSLRSVEATNAFFVDSVQVPVQTVTGCWIPPSVPDLQFPKDDSLLEKGSDWDINPHFDWDSSQYGCVLAQEINYEFELYTDAGLTSLHTQHLTTSAEMNASEISEGKYWWRVRSCDNAENCSDWSNVFNFVYDTKAPIVQINNPQKWKENGDELSGEVNIKISITDDNAYKYTLEIEDAEGNDMEKLEDIEETSNLNEELVFRWNTENVDDGTYVIKLVARDVLGNRDPGSSITEDPGVDTDSVRWIIVKVKNENAIDVVPTIDAIVEINETTDAEAISPVIVIEEIKTLIVEEPELTETDTIEENTDSDQESPTHLEDVI
jgi:hypothetical protein